MRFVDAALDGIMDAPWWLFFGGLVAIVAVLVVLLAGAQERAMVKFRADCAAANFTQAQCDVLAQTKRDADSAREAASFAVGFSAASAGRR